MPKCKSCGKKVDKDEVVRVGLSSFCSFDHAYSSGSKPIKKKSASKAKKLASKSKVEKVPDEVREMVLARDSHRCRLCGKSPYNLAVHHVYYRSEAKHEVWLNQPHNLITLCNEPCHLSVVHGNKKKYQSLCLGIIWLREVLKDRYTLIPVLEERLNEKD